MLLYQSLCPRRPSLSRGLAAPTGRAAMPFDASSPGSSPATSTHQVWVRRESSQKAHPSKPRLRPSGERPSPTSPMQLLRATGYGMAALAGRAHVTASDQPLASSTTIKPRAPSLPSTPVRGSLADFQRLVAARRGGRPAGADLGGNSLLGSSSRSRAWLDVIVRHSQQ